jgi:hypothetical protein
MHFELPKPVLTMNHPKVLGKMKISWSNGNPAYAKLPFRWSKPKYKKNHLAEAGHKMVNLCTLLEIKKSYNHWQKGKAVIKTSGNDNKPELICKYPTYVEQTVYHNSPTEQEIWLGFYSLKPYETKPLLWSKTQQQQLYEPT